MKDCPSSVKTVSVLFDGDKDPANNTLLKLADGGASGVGIRLYEADRTTPIPIGNVSKAVDVTAATDGGSADLNFFANYKSDGAAVNVGVANSVSNFVMVYN